ncbi:MAG TPA: thiamine phosphate synthase [Polyangia bacterium]|jgi:thiamine-phosphate pyrophosphorylase
MPLAQGLRGYYAILDIAAAQSADPARALARAARLLAARPAMIQIRAKAAGAAALAALARALLPLARAAGVPLCVNDRLDVALAVGADAVHLGQDDVPLADARRLAGNRLVIGVSTHNPSQAALAMAGGADYIGLGPIFATTTKTNPDPVVGLETLRQVAATASVPVIAIGGITLERVAAVAAMGASAAALIGAIEASADATSAGRAVNAAFDL